MFVPVYTNMHVYTTRSYYYVPCHSSYNTTRAPYFSAWPMSGPLAYRIYIFLRRLRLLIRRRCSFRADEIFILYCEKCTFEQVENSETTHSCARSTSVLSCQDERTACIYIISSDVCAFS